MATSTLNLDKLAARQAQAIVQDVLKKAQEEAENEAKKRRKNQTETQHDVQALQKKRIDTLERLATKALGVLQARGVYACMLFLYSRSSEEAKVAPSIRVQFLEALKVLPVFTDETVPDDAQAALKFYSDNVAGNTLDTLLLVRDLYEQTLIYARYHAKALKEEE
ncbi:MAG: hypothetical protein J7L69_00490 [Desulfobulbaceae bacterium]|nr:hypothetical protein [Desulfobulbaceae bacterium]